MKPSYLEIDPKNLSKIKSRFNLLVVTATKIEEEEFHSRMKPLPGHDKILSLPKGKETYFLGVFGAYNVVHVSCGEMGSVGVRASLITTSNAIRVWKPKVVLMPGIAFAADKKEQLIGDVLVAERIKSYEQSKLTPEGKIDRGKESPTSTVLLNRFKSNKTWNQKVGERTAVAHIGLMISGEKLINDPVFKAAAIADASTAIGGEMEGVGIYNACDNDDIECILVKGVCDYADGNKDKDKDPNQLLAIQSAVSLCEQVFSSTVGFNEIGLKVSTDEIEIDDFGVVTVGMPNWLKAHAKVLKADIIDEN